MAGPRACRSLCQNLASTGADEFAGAALGAPTNDSGTSSYTAAVLCIPTAASALAIALAPTEAMAKYTNKNLQRAKQLTINLFI